LQEGRVDYFESISNISVVVDVDFHDIELVIGELEVLLQERTKLLARTAPTLKKINRNVSSRGIRGVRREMEREG